MKTQAPEPTKHTYLTDQASRVVNGIEAQDVEEIAGGLRHLLLAMRAEDIIDDATLGNFGREFTKLSCYVHPDDPDPYGGRNSRFPLPALSKDPIANYFDLQMTAFELAEAIQERDAAKASEALAWLYLFMDARGVLANHASLLQAIMGPYIPVEAVARALTSLWKLWDDASEDVAGLPTRGQECQTTTGPTTGP
jgi:hypothetical protein